MRVWSFLYGNEHTQISPEDYSSRLFRLKTAATYCILNEFKSPTAWESRFPPGCL